jgi:hypothetical protein
MLDEGRRMSGMRVRRGQGGQGLKAAALADYISDDQLAVITKGLKAAALVTQQEQGCGGAGSCQMPSIWVLDEGPGDPCDV